MSIKYNSNYFYDVPESTESSIPDYVQFEKPYERTPELIGVLAFCGERGPAGVTNLICEQNSDSIVTAEGKEQKGYSTTLCTRSGEIED